MNKLKSPSAFLWIGLIIIFLSNCSEPFCPDKQGGPVTPVTPPVSSSSEIMSWTIKNLGLADTLLSVSVTSESTAYMCGLKGVIYKTTDSANSLTRLNSGTTSNLYSILFLDANTGFAVGDNSTILKTTNAGGTWSPASSPISSNYRKIFFLNSSIGFIVGGSGGMIKTTNGGLNWTALTLPTTVGLHGVFFNDANTGYVSGQQYTMLKTIDGGANWNFVNTGLTNGNIVTPLTSIFFTSQDTGYAVGGRSYPTGTDINAIIKTTDAGVTWVKQKNPDSTNVFYTVRFMDSKLGYIAGMDMANNTGLILKTTNGGLNWNVQVTSPLHKIYCLDIYSSGMGYADGFNGTLLKGNF